MSAHPPPSFDQALPTRQLALRRVALTLHALPSADRRWLLDQMAGAQRQAIEPLLQELVALGVPAQPELARQACAGPATPASTGVARLAQASADQAWAWLQGEPDLLIAEVLRLGPFAWQAELLTRLGPARRHAIVSALADQGAPPDDRRNQALLRALSSRTSASPPQGSVRALSRPGWQGWLNGLRSKVGASRDGR